jgi:hypothetical protein
MDKARRFDACAAANIGDRASPGAAFSAHGKRRVRRARPAFLRRIRPQSPRCNNFANNYNELDGFGNVNSDAGIRGEFSRNPNR